MMGKVTLTSTGPADYDRTLNFPPEHSTGERVARRWREGGYLSADVRRVLGEPEVMRLLLALAAERSTPAPAPYTIPVGQHLLILACELFGEPDPAGEVDLWARAQRIRQALEESRK